MIPCIGHRCGIGSESSRCLSVADYVREPQATREAPRRANVAYALGAGS